MEKIERLRSAFDEAGIDGILLTNEHSRRYMANFTGTAGVVLISKDVLNLQISVTSSRQVNKRLDMICTARRMSLMKWQSK